MGLGVATFGRQWGELAPLRLDAVHLSCVHLVLGHGDHLHELPNTLRLRQFLQRGARAQKSDSRQLAGGGYYYKARFAVPLVATAVASEQVDACSTNVCRGRPGVQELEAGQVVKHKVAIPTSGQRDPVL